MREFLDELLYEKGAERVFLYFSEDCNSFVFFHMKSNGFNVRPLNSQTLLYITLLYFNLEIGL